MLDVRLPLVEPLLALGDAGTNWPICAACSLTDCEDLSSLDVRGPDRIVDSSGDVSVDPPGTVIIHYGRPVY